MTSDVRRRPVVWLSALGPPDLAPGGRVEHHQKSGIEVIEVEQQASVVQRERRAFAEGHVHPHLHAEVFLPERRAVQVVGVESA